MTDIVQVTTTPAERPASASAQVLPHDPLEFASQLGAKLASRFRHVCLLMGAGTSRACGLPDVAGLQLKVAEGLQGEDRAAFQRLLTGRNIEELLSRLRRISALQAGGDTIDGLTSDAAQELDRKICKQIVATLDAAQADLTPVNHLTSWVMRTRYDKPLEIFTVNYDLLMETALDTAGVPYFDGFVGNLRAAFRADLVDDQPGETDEAVPRFFIRYWKLHGSLNWTHESGGRVVRLGRAASDGQAAAIYPSDTKYEESRRIPFLALQDRFRRSLNMPESLVLIVGYSFSDQHLNEALFEAARRRPRSEFIAFCYGDIPESVASIALVTPNLQVFAGKEAILAGIRAPWKKADVAQMTPLPTGLHLGDFKDLASYLSRAVSASTMTPTSAEGAASSRQPGGSGARNGS